jgi:hypothetical protein
MLKRVAESFRSGIARIKWFSTVIAERLKIEVAVVGLLHRSDTVRRQREDLVRTIGERIWQLRTDEERNVFKDSVVREALGKIEALDREIEELNKQVQDVSRVGT